MTAASDHKSDHYHSLRNSRQRKQGGLVGEGNRAEIHIFWCDLLLEIEITLIFFTLTYFYLIPHFFTFHFLPSIFHLSPFTLHSLHYSSSTSTTLCLITTINIHYRNHQSTMSNMSSPLSEIDRELIGELPNNSGATATMAKANGEPDTEAHAHHLGTAFTPLNATAGASVKISSNGDEVETGKVSQHVRVPPHLPLIHMLFLPPSSFQYVHPSSTLHKLALIALHFPTYLTPFPLRLAAIRSSTTAHSYSIPNFTWPTSYEHVQRRACIDEEPRVWRASQLPSRIVDFYFSKFTMSSARSLFNLSLSYLLSPLTLFPSLNSRADQTKVNKDTKMDTTEPALKTPKKRGAAASANDESAQPAKKRSPTKKAAAPSNVEVNTNGETTETTTPTVKKRASPKKKAVATPNADIKDSEMNGETEGPEPVTPPKKGKRASAKGKSKANDDSADTTDKSVSPTKGNGEIEGTTVHNTPRKRQAPKKELAAPRGIPNSWENADPADRLMVSMKEKGQSWTEIRATWKEVTGQDTAPRYAFATHSIIDLQLTLPSARSPTATIASKST